MVDQFRNPQTGDMKLFVDFSDVERCALCACTHITTMNAEPLSLRFYILQLALRRSELAVSALVYKPQGNTISFCFSLDEM